MKFKFLLATLALFTTQMTYAAPKAAPKTAPTYYGTQSYGSSSGGMDIGVMGPINLIGGTAYWGADVMGLWSISSVQGLSIGAELGFQFASIAGGTGWHAPILATGIYQLNIAGLNNMKPFVGMGIGIGIVGSPGVTVPVLGTVGGGTSAAFELLVHAGMSFKPEFQGLFARLSLGTANSAFVFMPSVGYFF